MHTWQLQEAKAKLTQLVNEALMEPQIISRRGVPEIVVMSLDRYKKITRSKRDIVAYMRNSPLYGTHLDLERDKSPMRDIDL